MPIKQSGTMAMTANGTMNDLSSATIRK